MRTTAGLVQGVDALVTGVAAFLGMPYAASPAGPLRLRPPQVPAPWAGERPAAVAGPVAHQRQGPLERLFGGYGEMNEDCLSLNVWTPGPQPGADRPVLVWIHGGSFTTGAGAIPWYDGSRLSARGDIVVVTLNYRLGALGFLHLADIGGTQWNGSGNTGLLDQIAALEWVQANIEAFGGDPERVTVFGESAGAMSIATLMAMPSAKGLFHRAILQSGAGTFVQDRATATGLAAEVLGELGVGHDELERLAEVPVAAILEAQAGIWARAGFGLTFIPVVDGDTLPAWPEARLAAGAAAGIPVLVGTNRDEMRLFAAVAPATFATDDDVALLGHVAAISDVGPRRAATVLDAYRRRWPELAPTDLHLVIQGDHAFRRPGQRLAAIQAASGAGAWSYWFTWASPILGGMLGSYHGLEIPFAFDNLERPGIEMLTGGGELQDLADQMAGAWLAFARDGDPGWPAYNPADRATMGFDLPPELLHDPDAELRQAWESIGL